MITTKLRNLTKSFVCYSISVLRCVLRCVPRPTISRRHGICQVSQLNHAANMRAGSPMYRHRDSDSMLRISLIIPRQRHVKSREFGHSTYRGTRNNASRARMSKAIPMISSEALASPMTPKKAYGVSKVAVPPLEVSRTAESNRS